MAAIPIPKIVPSPCGAEVDRNWDAVGDFFNNVVTYIVNNLGTKLAEIELVPGLTDCQPEIVFTVPITFRPLYLDDPANPTIPPEWVWNYRGLGIAEFEAGVAVKGYIAWDANTNEWELVQVDHVRIETLGSVEKVPGAVEFIGNVITAPYCGAHEDSIDTVLARALRALGLQDGGGTCILYSNEVELEVFDSTTDPADYEEISFEAVQVLTDVYQAGAFGNIVGYYWRIFTPCSSLVGEEILIYVDRCDSGTSSGL
jgi:hypothetical protein